MTRDDVLKLAREVGIVAIHADGASNWSEEVEVLERFAALVAASASENARADYEREHCRHVVPLPDALRVMIDEAVAAEREACAKVCDDLHWPWRMGDESGPKDCAAAIRARGSHA